jgi:putative transposase
VGTLKGWGVRISMDGRGRWMDNVFIERLWRSIKYEDIYLHEYASVRLLEIGIGKWLESYNTWRPHETLDNRTPRSVYRPKATNKPPIKAVKRAA